MSGTIAIHLSGVLIGDLGRRCVHGPIGSEPGRRGIRDDGRRRARRSSLMASVTDFGSQKTGGSSGRPALDRRAIILWEAGALVFIVLGASALHFLYELSGLQTWATIFGSVNESTFEHLKLFFWPAIAWAFVQHAYTRDRVMNFWWAKALSIITAPLVLMLSFYFYLGISLPIFGRGFLWADIGTGVLGVLAGNVVSYSVMTAPEKGRGFARLGLAICVAMGVMFIAFTYLPPRFFLFENFARYQYSGEYGTLEDYTPYLVFRKAS
jgi:hypothetical protein